MKKLLLTLLGATLLCGLSPHPLSAQTDHPKITRTYSVKAAQYTNSLVTLSKRVNGALDGATNTADYTLSDSEPITPTASLGTAEPAHGWGRVQIKSASDDDEPLTIDFDFSNCSTTPKKEGNPAWYQNTSYIGTSIYMYTGTRFKMSFNKDKRIKAIYIKTNIYGNSQSKAFTSYKKNLKCIKDLNNDAEDTRFTLKASTLDNDGLTVIYESPSLYGETPSLTLDFVNEEGYYYFQIFNIQIQYYDNSDGWMPAYDNTFSYGRNYADAIYYKNGDATDWTEATGSERINLDGETVKTRIGNAITTFNRPASPKAGQHTVIIDPAKGMIGATVGVTFHTSLDPDYLANGDINEAYLAEYQLTNYLASGSSAQKSSGNVTPPSGAVAYDYNFTTIIGSITNVDGLTASNSLYTVKTPTADIFTGLAATADQKNGLDMAFAFDGLKVKYTSNAIPPVQNPMVPEVTISEGATLNPADNVYNLFKDAKATVKHNAACLYPDAKIYYIISDKRLDSKTFDKAKATLLGEDPIP
ncbi:MAG: hypothetical protein K2H99_03245, partial [Paramuribaculum sp.]|nr:hypothetical protein [Paramuribaculum sp.]